MLEYANLVSSLFRVMQHASLLQIVVAPFALLAARYILQAVYRVYFHPLRNFPGPKLSAISRLPKVIATWNGEQHRYHRALHAQYGEIVRVAPEELSFIHPDAWPDIYGHGSGQSKALQGSVPPKHWDWYGRSSNGLPHLAQTADPLEHARVRRIFTPAFSDRALKEQEPLFMKYVDQLMGNLRRVSAEEPKHKFDMVRNYNFTTFDVMGDLTFGESLHMLDNSEYDPWVSLNFVSTKFAVRFNLLSYYPWLSRYVKRNIPAKMQKKKYEQFQYSVERVSKRLQKGRASEGRDLWDNVLSQDKNKQLSRDEMDSNATLFMLAGTETTATLLSGLTYLLLKNPDKMAKLCEEIRNTFQAEKDIFMESIAALPYLAVCLKEALRLYPPVAVEFPHLTPANGSTICGRFVPPGITVGTPQWTMYTSPLNFKDPDSFIPERWMNDNEEFASDRKAVVQPFAVGPRNCLGQNMAYHEMRLIITKLLYNFDLTLCPDSENWMDQKTYLLWDKPPLMVTLTDRKVAVPQK